MMSCRLFILVVNGWKEMNETPPGPLLCKEGERFRPFLLHKGPLVAGDIPSLCIREG
jgi:hypothetical protein